MLSSDWRTHSALAIVLMCVEKEAGAATIALERARTDPSEKKKPFVCVKADSIQRGAAAVCVTNGPVLASNTTRLVGNACQGSIRPPRHSYSALATCLEV